MFRVKNKPLVVFEGQIATFNFLKSPIFSLLPDFLTEINQWKFVKAKMSLSDVKKSKIFSLPRVILANIII